MAPGTGRSACGLPWGRRVSPPSCATSCCAPPSEGWTAAPWRHSAGGHGRDDWVAAGRFLDSYAARFDLAPVPAYDYAEIVRIAGSLLRRSAVRAREREAYDVVLVDEYQDTDPAQEELLVQLAGDGRELIAVGDPDQSIYAFRGADVTAMRRFTDRFRAPDGRCLPMSSPCARAAAVALTCLAASRRIATRLPVAVGPPRRRREPRAQDAAFRLTAQIQVAFRSSRRPVRARKPP